MQESERLSSLTFVPALSTGFYYLLPPHLQDQTVVQFIPQALAYMALLAWVSQNRGIIECLGLRPQQFRQGLKWGAVVGLILGFLNVGIILLIVPWLGDDITFLKTTPHARIPAALMVPWVIILIAIFVEVNFRGFQLGRWLAVCRGSRLAMVQKTGPFIAMGISSLVFAYDPFLVATFKHLHWIAIWDGIVWGIIWIRLRNLYATIIAHALEVIIMYSIIRLALT